MRARRTQQPTADTQPSTPIQSSSIALAKKQALEALVLAQFGLDRASAAIDEAMRRLQTVDDTPPARLELLQPEGDEAAPASISPNQLLKLSEVRRLVGLGSSTIYQRMGNGRFPRPLQLGPQTVRWRRGDLDTWLAGLQPAIESSKPPITLADTNLRATRIAQRMRRPTG